MTTILRPPAVAANTGTQKLESSCSRLASNGPAATHLGLAAYHRPMPTVVILRHGESTWNRENLFTGWHDVPLSESGELEARRAGDTLREAGLWFDVVHTSLLTRAVDTATLALGRPRPALAPGRAVLAVERAPLRRPAGARQEGDDRAPRPRADQALAPLLRRASAARGLGRPGAPGPGCPVPAAAPGRAARHRVPEGRGGQGAAVLARRRGPAAAGRRWSPWWSPTATPCGRWSSTWSTSPTPTSPSSTSRPGAPRRYDLDDDLGVVSARYLGDADAVAAAAAAVAQQAGA